MTGGHVTSNHKSVLLLSDVLVICLVSAIVIITLCPKKTSTFLSTHADRHVVDISFTVCLFVCLFFCPQEFW